MVSAMSDPANIVRTSRLLASDGLLVRHPLNPASEVRIQHLSDRAGLKRAALSLARVPPGKESFVAHAHGMQEEFVFILEGRGKALIGEQEFDVGPGDYVGYPTDGTPHNLRNDGDVDLVYLQGGERAPLEVTQFPTLGRVGVFDASGLVRFYDASAAEVLPLTAWVAK